MLSYIFDKVYNDYMLVSLDGTVESGITNISLIYRLWIKRIYGHLIKN